MSAARIDEIEATTRHDVIAFLTNLEEALGADSRFVHMGLTSSDVVDTALALQLQRASRPAAGRPRALPGRRSARSPSRTSDTLCVGRTHGVHAEPMTFGLKAALWYAEAGRNLERLRRAREAVRVGKISGAVGTFAHVDPDVEEEACRLLGLEPAPVSTQIVQRDRHAEFCATLAIVGGLAREGRGRDPVAPAHRGRSRPRSRSRRARRARARCRTSATPSSRENVCGLARLVRGNALAALENVALWHERDISHSSVERVILPDAHDPARLHARTG